MDLKKADLGLLASLDALLQTASVTTAARSLGISQPALSAQLARLRELFGDPLLVGNAHGMKLTPRAEAIREPLSHLLGQLNGLVRNETHFDPGTAEREFTIGASDLVHSMLMPGILYETSRDTQNIRFAAIMPQEAKQLRGLDEGDFDFLITTEPKTPDAYPAVKLTEETFSVIWRQGHSQIGGKISLEEFCSVPHIMVSTRGGGFSGATDKALSSQGLKRRVIGSLPSFLTVPEVVRHTDCIAVVPSRIAAAQSSGHTVSKPPIETESFSLYLSWHPRMKNDPGHRWAVELIKRASRTSKT